MYDTKATTISKLRPPLKRQFEGLPAKTVSSKSRKISFKGMQRSQTRTMPFSSIAMITLQMNYYVAAVNSLAYDVPELLLQAYKKESVRWRIQ